MQDRSQKITQYGYEEIRARISQEIAIALNVNSDELDPHKEFSLYGLDSIVAFTITGNLCDWIGEELPATFLWEYPTIHQVSNQIVNYLNTGIDESQNDENESSSILLSSSNSQTNLYCICGIELYKPLAVLIEDNVKSYGLYVPPEKSLGKIGSDIDQWYRFKSVESLASQYVEETLRIDSAGPYRLMGLSFGGILAFEVAQQLTRRGLQVDQLVLLDSVLPTAIRMRAYRHAIDTIKRTAASIGATSTHRNIENNETAVSFEALTQARADFYWRLSKNYKPEIYAGDATLVRATATKLFGRGYIFNDQLGWQELVDGTLKTIRINATHTGILEVPAVNELAKEFISS